MRRSRRGRSLGALSAVIRTQLDIDPAFVAAIIKPRCFAPGLAGCRVLPEESCPASWTLTSSTTSTVTRISAASRTGSRTWISSSRRYSLTRTRGLRSARKGITALEDILFSKYLMYKTVYWHKTVRIATAMIKKAVAMGLADGAITRSDLYGLDDEEFFARFSASRYPAVRAHRAGKAAGAAPPGVDGSLSGSRNPSHQRIEDIRGEAPRGGQDCARGGGHLRESASRAEDIVLDVPERVSFDFDVPVVEPGSGRTLEAHGAQARSSVFSGMGGDDLPRSIRYISVSASRDEALMAALERLDIGEIIAQ